MKRAFITGITGQDGSYLAELLLEKGYEVHGMVRRSSTEKFDRIEHIRDRVTLHQADLLDQRSLTDALRASKPDEIYNLAAMSFVAVSWIQPTLTAEFTGVGVTRLLEAVREVCPEARFYQASSSEMFGKVQETPQSETTSFWPRSPYGVAKVYGHWITVNYRESYDLFACSGILFNHECLRAQTPLVIRRDGVISIETPADLVPLRKKGPSVQTFDPEGLVEVWDGEGWTPITAVTATRRRASDPDHRLVSIETRGGVVETTAHHTMLASDRSEVKAADVAVGDRLALAEAGGESPQWSSVTLEMGEFLGLMCADGYVAREGARPDFTNNDEQLRRRVAELWSRLFLQDSTEYEGRSGFSDEPVMKLNLNGGAAIAPWLRDQLYTRTGHKRVPAIVLNASREVQEAFLAGYYAGDGLKRGNGLSVKTNSAVLAQGLCWLYDFWEQPCTVYVERRGPKTYYQLNVRAAATVTSGMRGQHLAKDPAEVRRIVEVAPTDTDDFVFDLETESGVFCAGVGRLIVHNSPRRGLEFVTRKITWHAAAIKLGLRDHIALGNLDAKRDWGHAKDYVEAMWLMLQQDEPDDFVIATGETNTVQRCVEVAFDQVGISDWRDYVRIDDQFKRPAEVDLLVGDRSKAERQLGWTPATSFEQLIRQMVDADLKLLGG